MFALAVLLPRFGLGDFDCCYDVGQFHVEFSVVSGHSEDCCDNNDRSDLFSRIGGILRFKLDKVPCFCMVFPVLALARKNSRGCYSLTDSGLLLLQVPVLSR